MVGLEQNTKLTICLYHDFWPSVRYKPQFKKKKKRILFKQHFNNFCIWYLSDVLSDSAVLANWTIVNSE